VTRLPDTPPGNAGLPTRRAALLARSTAALVGAGLLLTGCGTTAPPTEAAAPACPTTASAPTVVPDVPRTSRHRAVAPSQREFVLPPAGSDVLLFGDSWTQSTGATCPTVGYAARLAAEFGWVPDIQGFGGTGFVARGVIDADYLTRLQALPATSPALVLVQGGLNDALAGASEAAELAAARAVLDLVVQRYPQAQVVVLGPPQTQVVDPTTVAAMDRALAQASAEHQVPYLSPQTARWDLQRFTTGDGLHPDDLGHENLAALVAAALRALDR
jgi:lysophospholipase L1-like esterase